MITVDPSDLHAAADAMRSVDDRVRSGEIAGEAAQPLADEFPAALAALATGSQDRRVLVDEASGTVDRDALVLEAATSLVPLSGGLVPAEHWAAVEFGSGRPGLPPRQPAGRVLMPAVREIQDKFAIDTETALAAEYRAAVGDEH